MDTVLNAAALRAMSDELTLISKEAAPPIGELLSRAGEFLTSGGRKNFLEPLGEMGHALHAGLVKRVTGKGGLIGGITEIPHRLTPKGVVEGWETMAPVRDPRMAANIQKAVSEPVSKWYSPTSWKGVRGYFGPSSAGFIDPSKSRELGKILRDKDLTVGGKIRETAEEMGRRGWTGLPFAAHPGRVTKYLPMGPKSLALGFAGMEVPGLFTAPAPTPTGEDSTLERVGRFAGGNIGFIGGSGLGLLPMMGLWYALGKGGELTGRTLDRLRAGADLKTAITGGPAKMTVPEEYR